MAKMKTNMKTKTKAKLKPKPDAKTKPKGKKVRKAKAQSKANSKSKSKLKSKSKSISKLKPSPKPSKSLSSDQVRIQASLDEAEVSAIPSSPNLTNYSLGSQGKAFNLNEYLGQKLVLFFYPKDNTPGCTIESNEFNSLLGDFSALNTLLIGVSRDSLQSHQKFINKFNLKMDLVSDVEEELCQKFSVIKDKNMYGRMVKGIERSTFLFDEQGRLLKEWRKVSAQGHAAEVLAFLKSL